MKEKTMKKKDEEKSMNKTINCILEIFLTTAGKEDKLKRKKSK